MIEIVKWGAVLEFNIWAQDWEIGDAPDRVMAFS
jgi:hypothetical protein